MSETSSTMIKKINTFLKDIKQKDKILALGYIRIHALNNNISIPSSIINYCIIYTFLCIAKWLKSGPDIIINNLIAKRMNKGVHYQSVYGSVIASKGKHLWKLKIHERGDHIIIGIHCASKDFCHTYFYNNEYSYAYHGQGTKLSKRIQGSYPNSNAQRFGLNDIIGIHLDMDKGIIGFSKNGKYLGNSCDNLDKTMKYRLAVCMHRGSTTIEMLSYFDKY